VLKSAFCSHYKIALLEDQKGNHL